MRFTTAAVALCACLAISACSKSTQDKTGADLKAVGADTAQAAKDVANAPAAKELGSDIKQGTKEAADKTAEATKEAAAKLKAGADQAGDKLKSGADKAGDQIKTGAQDAADKTKSAVDKAQH